MINATSPLAATTHLHAPPSTSNPVELRTGNGDDGRLKAFPRALQSSVDEPASAEPAPADAAQPVRREGPADASVDAPGAAGDDADRLLAELRARRMPRDIGAEAAQAASTPAEMRAPNLGAGLDTPVPSSLDGKATSAADQRGATEPSARLQVGGQTVVPPAPGAPNTAAQPVPEPGAGQTTASGIGGPWVMAADDATARPANDAGHTAFTPALPMSQALSPAGLSAASATGVSAEARLTAAPGSADFSSQLGAQLTTFVREGVQHARLHLHPAELGPVTVRIQIDGQAARVHMAAEHALTRQALEQSMPMLAGSLREAGLTLSGGGVFEQPRQRDGDDAPGQPGAGTANAPGSVRSPATPLRTATGMPVRRGVVDLVA